jgi:hypothetical protein
MLDPSALELYVEWDEMTDIAVSGLREVAASDPEDPRLRSLIAEPWPRADVGHRSSLIHLRHPFVGGQHLLIYG